MIVLVSHKVTDELHTRSHAGSALFLWPSKIHSISGIRRVPSSCCISYFFSPCCDEMPGKRQLKDSWLWPIDHGYSPSWWGRHGRQYEAAGHSVHSCEAQGWQPCSADLLLIHGMVPYPEWVFRLQLNFSGITFTEVCLPADSTSWYTSWYIHCQPPHTRHYLEFNDHSLVCLFL